MSLDRYIQQMLPAVEEELKLNLDRWVPIEPYGLRQMLSYHMGWEGIDAGPEAQGKRIRPLLVLLSAAAAGGEWRKALPLAAAVEYIHNFSLIHDDIQDEGRLRRGRPTVWVKWGVAQAINAGDLMYTLAFQTITRSTETQSQDVAFQAGVALQSACARLIRGQYLDLLYEKEQKIVIEDYWPMIEGKTAALLSCCTELGAISAGVDGSRQSSFKKFGFSLGLAFQVVDDWLGIWGNAEIVGKSTSSDLVSGKKTLPVLYSLGLEKRFSARWSKGNIKANEVEELARYLVEEGAQAYTEKIADDLTKEALESLNNAVIKDNDAAIALRELASKLIQRRS